MKVYKFGGASIKDARGVRNLRSIIAAEKEPLVVVVSAMGKTTNALERVVNALWLRETEQAEREWVLIKEYHDTIARETGVKTSFEVPEFRSPYETYDELYDQFVSYGELFSSHLISLYLKRLGLPNILLDMTSLLITDSSYRHANVDIFESEKRLQNAIKQSPEGNRLWVTQGFIGGTIEGRNTTLGREGSDYSAALVGNFLNAESVTIWKDVAGILTADPRKDSTARLIKELNYADAARLASSGAQIIHSKTIEPLEEKHIPLYVKSFLNPAQPGSVIHDKGKKLDMAVNWGK